MAMLGGHMEPSLGGGRWEVTDPLAQLHWKSWVAGAGAGARRRAVCTQRERLVAGEMVARVGGGGEVVLINAVYRAQAVMVVSRPRVGHVPVPWTKMSGDAMITDRRSKPTTGRCRF